MRKEPSWSNEYINIPFLELGRDHNGCDCYGLVRLVLLERCSIVIPSFVEEYTDIKQYRKIANKIQEQANALHDWIPVLRGTEQPYDVLVANMMGFPMHVGIIVKKNLLLHVIEGSNSCTVAYNKGEWKQPHKIVGIYRHRSLCTQ